VQISHRLRGRLILSVARRQFISAPCRFTHEYRFAGMPRGWGFATATISAAFGVSYQVTYAQEYVASFELFVGGSPAAQSKKWKLKWKHLAVLLAVLSQSVSKESR
jgi:hypothetical protein